MRIVYKKTSKTEYFKPQIESGTCNICLSRNIYNERCVDCGNSMPLIYFERRNLEKKNHILKMRFGLSDTQKKASEFFINKYKKHEDGFLNAVCGSGKTEIMYGVILYALNKGDKAAIVIPRKEIVKELYDRLKEVFPNTNIKYIDGEHHDDDCDLLLSTVNQLIHYEDEFDLIILDEADAFPYSGSEFLHRLVKKSLKKESSLFLMSATKKERIKSEKFVMNRRYHKHDLSMPKFIKYNESDITLCKKFTDIISSKERKIIIYADSIKNAYDLSDKLNCLYISSKVEGARDIIKRFKENNEHLLVSTTILERGITVKNLDVIIVNAESTVFTHQTIIQICGRVGRSYDDPIGSIYIFYHKKMLKFLKVKNYIRRMNALHDM